MSGEPKESKKYIPLTVCYISLIVPLVAKLIAEMYF